MKNILRTIVLVSALFGISPAYAACTGQFLGGTICANNTTLQNIPGPTANPVLGVPGINTGTLGFAGSSSGTATISAQAGAGAATLFLPTTSGTIPSTASAPLVLNAGTGVLTLPGLAGGVLAGSGPAFTITPVLGVPTSSQGTLGFAGATSGTATVTAQATAGSPTITLPNTSGTLADGASAPLVLSATTGNLTCPTCLTTTGSFANPTASVGLTAVNGSATTAMRSDAAPALSSSVQTALTGTNGRLLIGTGAFGFSAITLGGDCTFSSPNITCTTTGGNTDVGSGGTSTDRAIPTWNGTGGNLLRNNSLNTISAAGAFQIDAGFGATSVLYFPPNLSNSSICYGNGCTTLVHNAGQFTATITGTDLNVTAITSGTVPFGTSCSPTITVGATGGTLITAFTSGTPGGIGHYVVSPSQTVASPTAMTTISLQGYYNTMVGETNFLNATTSCYNTGVGFEVMEFDTTGSYNTGIGEAALIYNATGNGNTAVGWKALLNAVGHSYGDYNTAIGYSSGWSSNGHDGMTQNTSVGAFSLSGADLTGNLNVAIGYNAGGGISAGSNNTLVGPNVTPALATGSNNTAIGACNSGYVAATAGLVQICDGAGNVAFSKASGGFVSLGSQLNLASGGTQANLSATGGTSQVVQQTTVGGAFTVGQLTGNDLTKSVYIICMSAATGMTVTGTTGETTLATCAIPGNTLGANGALRITSQWSKTGTAGTTEARMKFGGTTYYDSGAAGATVLSGRAQTEIHNRNATNSQIGTATGQLNFALQATTASVTTALDTTTSQNITFTCQLGNTGDTCELSSYTVEVLKP